MSVNIADTLGRIGKGFWLALAKDLGLADGRNIEDAIKNLEALEKGRNRGYVFETEEAMNTWLANADNVAKLVLGDNLYIKATNVPDYWWNGTSASQLETQKVDLSEYLTKDRGIENKGKSLIVGEDGMVTEGESSSSDVVIVETEEEVPEGDWKICIVENGVQASDAKNNIYSTDEVVIGTWIDGKPIYRKVVVLNINSLNSDNAYDLSNIFLDTLVRLMGTSQNTSNVMLPVPYSRGSDHITFFVNNAKLGYRVSQSSFFGKCNLTIEYTKTTD